MDIFDKKKVDGQIQNNGLNNSSIKRCAERYLENAQKADGFLKKAVSQGVVGLLRLPILLLMICVIFVEKGTFPKKTAEIIRDIIDMYIMRARERGVHLEDPEQILLLLGKLSYENELLISKVSVILL